MARVGDTPEGGTYLHQSRHGVWTDIHRCDHWDKTKLCGIEKLTLFSIMSNWIGRISLVQYG